MRTTEAIHTVLSLGLSFSLSFSLPLTLCIFGSNLNSHSSLSFFYISFHSVQILSTFINSLHWHYYLFDDHFIAANNTHQLTALFKLHTQLITIADHSRHIKAVRTVTNHPTVLCPKKQRLSKLSTGDKKEAKRTLFPLFEMRFGGLATPLEHRTGFYHFRNISIDYRQCRPP